MNAAIRLANILKKMKSSTRSRGYEIFIDTFETSNCVGIANKLLLCNKQVEIVSEKSHQALTTYLRKIFNCQTSQRDMRSDMNDAEPYIMALETAGAYMAEDKIDRQSIKELSDLIIKMRVKIENSSMEDYYSEILNSYVDEIQEAIVDIDIGGIEGFTNHIENANGKVVLYNEVFSKPDFKKDINEIYEKSTKILNDAQVWGGAIGYVMSNLLK